jgi:hypothetical protein
MIEISISRELADAHPGFMSGCAQRGHKVDVFDNDRSARGAEQLVDARLGQRRPAQAPPPARPLDTRECRRTEQR